MAMGSAYFLVVKMVIVQPIEPYTIPLPIPVYTPGSCVSCDGLLSPIPGNWAVCVDCGYAEHEVPGGGYKHFADKDVVNVANMRHIWVLDEPLVFAWRHAQ